MRKNQNMTSFSILAVLLSACGGRGNTTVNQRGSGDVPLTLRDEVLTGSVDETHEIVRLDTVKEMIAGDVNTDEGVLVQEGKRPDGQEFFQDIAYTIKNVQANTHWKATLKMDYEYVSPPRPAETLDWIVEISGPDMDDMKFVQEGTDVRLVTVNSIDYEAPTDSNGDNIYNVTLTFSRTDGQIVEQRKIELTVNNVEDDDRSMPILPEEITVQEGVSIVSHLYNYGISTAELEGTDAEDLQIKQTKNGPVLEFVSIPEHESPEDSDKNNVYEVLLFADDFGMPVDMEITVEPLPMEL